ncbi:alpha/beta fold hydrolase [Sorangium sp. So ce861]|uniref:alpha/beta fold hydrolase n=1 Tax=Sorangium sp. So ce861 TaxID=3133323 RepID=UPI003F619792
MLPRNDITHGHADVNGVRLHYASRGAGKLILFIHGFPELWYAWKRQLFDFGRHHRAVALDQRGYNLSSKPSAVDAYGIDLLAADIGALIEHLGEEKAVLVGHDVGAVVAWAVALRHPERVEKLVAINMSHPACFDRALREDPAQQAASQYMHLFRSRSAEEHLSRNNYGFLREIFLDPGLSQGYFSEADVRVYLEAFAQPGAMTGGLNIYRAAQIGPPGPGQPVGGSNLTRGLRSLTVSVPVLVIWGERDPYLLPASNLPGIELYVPDLRVMRVPEATHWIVHEEPEIVNAAIRGFLARERPRGGQPAKLV